MASMCPTGPRNANSVIFKSPRHILKVNTVLHFATEPSEVCHAVLKCHPQLLKSENVVPN